MGKCLNHPERETSYLCMKHEIFLCEDCLVCRDPGIYCKFRPSCPIWFIHKEKVREERHRAEAVALQADRMAAAERRPSSLQDQE
ncbi:hypothetical protein DENIS_2152 [Desulfonema ishimotonii]|uniref:B box-type domain-containing protein n=1 Tax=Desulfonema ishimotonii TaxID=45657 RepID=A0A401FW32_9BACT|nr:hypothetical protein [Desulfonema ishimotonii]GBC61192.1 hypothetical protein DENIS_2152 [Desulfonema ishimotonii]